MRGVSLAQIRQWTGGEWREVPDDTFEPTGVSTDTRTLDEGDLFIALKGPNFDGHRFVGEAFDKGAAAAVVERSREGGSDGEDEGPLLQVKGSGAEALGRIAREYRKSFDIPVVGVVGSSGKTTAKEMIAAVLERRFCVLKTRNNENNEIGVPTALLGLKEEHGAAVVEMGARKTGDIRYLCSVARPTIGVLLNIGTAHMEVFGSVERVAKAKGELLEYIGDESFVALVNADDRVVAKEVMRTKGRLLGFGLERGSYYSGEGLILDREGRGHFSLQLTSFDLKIPGRHNVYNALAAAAVGDQCGVPMGEISLALADFQPPEMRSQLLRKNGIIVINDCYNANPASVQAALQLLADVEPDAPRKIAVLSDMLELGEASIQWHHAIGKQVVSMRVDRLLATGPMSRATVEAAQCAGMTESALHFESKKELTAYLKGFLAPGDVVLVKGSRGMRMEDIVGQIP